MQWIGLSAMVCPVVVGEGFSPAGEIVYRRFSPALAQPDRILASPECWQDAGSPPQSTVALRPEIPTMRAIIPGLGAVLTHGLALAAAPIALLPRRRGQRSASGVHAQILPASCAAGASLVWPDQVFRSQKRVATVAPCE